jgi:hypothetical protein
MRLAASGAPVAVNRRSVKNPTMYILSSARTEASDTRVVYFTTLERIRMVGKDLERSSYRGLTEALFQHLPDGSEEKHENFVRIVGGRDSYGAPHEKRYHFTDQ